MLGSGDLAAFLELTARDPVTNVFAEYRARTTTLDPRWLGGEMWGRFDEKGRLTAACHVGANLVPVECDAADGRRVRRAGARPDPDHLHHRRTRTRPSRASGRWPAPRWADARELRWRQPHLVIDDGPRGRPEPRGAALGAR